MLLFERCCGRLVDYLYCSAKTEMIGGGEGRQRYVSKMHSNKQRLRENRGEEKENPKQEPRTEKPLSSDMAMLLALALFTTIVS